ncbi:FAD:protein FMN transferase [Novipirellula artificiosorum]|uniref:FAD:protein FMN transferase n=1 Tax=Novipirellula artificiosorum TaxID=2528016 RepID=A0A5C6DQU3_9BACT|nr:FAD:protein FMN transferase [Novipirellula artificiosorum]TWU39643.1 Thiamine biosynthesis lipoprotein ApbE precursor [Novipirellula artificiosorum]
MSSLTVVRKLSLAACLLLSLVTAIAKAEPPKILTLRGRTMGTTYMVKVFDPPAWKADIAAEIDAELRSVNAQMSTYLKSSELSRFNSWDSTDWFPVSSQTAEVVEAAIDVSKATEGAFDVTVGPLVNLWSFGPDPKTRAVPDAATIATLRESVGYQNLSVRTNPPALKKATPSLKVDLSSIAKGHGVDRVINVLKDAGARNVFVEIGGEVRTIGDKGGVAWKVGIENPATAGLSNNGLSLAAAHPLTDEAMATSGDYRIFFEVEGKRYSHTIDPRSGRPIEHDLASVSVIAKTCMKADAWATAINVLGADAGLSAAQSQGLDVLMIRREGRRFSRVGTGSLAKYAVEDPVSEIEDSALGAQEMRPWLQRLMPTLIVTMIGFGIIISAMAVGVIFGGKSISGSCGGLGGKKNEDGSVSCSLCSNPSDACKELRDKMETETQNG